MAEIQDEENYNYRSIIQIIYNNIKLLSFAWRKMKDDENYWTSDLKKTIRHYVCLFWGKGGCWHVLISKIRLD